MRRKRTISIQEEYGVFQSFTSLAHLINLFDELDSLVYSYKSDKNNGYMQTLLITQLIGLYCMVAETIQAWLLAIDKSQGNNKKNVLEYLFFYNDFKNKQKPLDTLLVNDKEFAKLRKKFFDSKKIFFESYFINCYSHKDKEDKLRLEKVFKKLFNTLPFTSNPKLKKLWTIYKKIYNKTKHGCLLFETDFDNQLYVPDSLKKVKGEVCNIKPLYITNSKLMLLPLNTGVEYIDWQFQEIMGIYFKRRFGYLPSFLEDDLNKLKELQDLFDSSKIKIAPEIIKKLLIDED